MGLSGTTIRAVDNLETRKKQGSCYTPQVIAWYLGDKSLGWYFYGTANGEPLPGKRHKTAGEIAILRLILNQNVKAGKAFGTGPMDERLKAALLAML